MKYTFRTEYIGDLHRATDLLMAMGVFEFSIEFEKFEHRLDTAVFHFESDRDIVYFKGYMNCLFRAGNSKEANYTHVSENSHEFMEHYFCPPDLPLMYEDLDHPFSDLHRCYQTLAEGDFYADHMTGIAPTAREIERAMKHAKGKNK